MRWSGIWRAVAAAVVGGLSVASCGGSDGAGGPEIVPPTAAIEVGSTVQFEVTTDDSVQWGLVESTTGATEGSTDGTTASPTHAAVPEEPPAYPLKVSANGRYLVDQNDRPWRVNADSAWMMSSEATPEEVEEYLDTRRAQGFNSFYLMAMTHTGAYTAAEHAEHNLDGDPAFATARDFSTAGATPESERYWAWIDSIVAEAAERGMVVMFAYTYLGFQGGDTGWYQEVLAQPSRQVLHDWGLWLGNRYKDDDNLLWLGLGDYTPPAGSEGALRVNAIAEGIKAAGATQLFLAEPSSPDELPSEAPDFGPFVDMNSFYGYGPGGGGLVYETADRAWRTSPALPAWMQEGTYEFENNSGQFSSEPWDTRRGRFWSVLAGGTAGDGFGTKDVWQWQNIPDSLQSPGAEYSTRAFELFDTLPWWDLQPSGTDPGFAGIELVPSGTGTWSEPDYITSALTGDREWLLAYVPVIEQAPRTFEVDMSALSGPARARWFDPTNGNYLAISDGYEYENAGTRTFTTPGRREDGTDDWLLVVDATGSDDCGSITPAGTYTAPTALTDGVSCEVTAALTSDPSVVAREVIPLTTP
jgi:hypothetical protein